MLLAAFFFHKSETFFVFFTNMIHRIENKIDRRQFGGMGCITDETDPDHKGDREDIRDVEENERMKLFLGTKIWLLLQKEHAYLEFPGHRTDHHGSPR